MDCADCVEQLDQYADRELNDREVAEVRRHLDECPPCEGRYQFQAGLRRLVKVCCDQGEAPAELREKLRAILF